MRSLAALAGDSCSTRWNNCRVILRTVVGSRAVVQGFGKVGGVVLALVILQVISSAFNLLGLSQFLTIAIWGGVLIATSIFALKYRNRRWR